jgi:hypothetical protein
VQAEIEVSVVSLNRELRTAVTGSAQSLENSTLREPLGRAQGVHRHSSEGGGEKLSSGGIVPS